MTIAVEYKEVTEEECGMRLDRWFKSHYEQLPFGYLQKLLRSGQVRVNGKRAKSDMRLLLGQIIRVPPLPSLAQPPNLLTMRKLHEKDYFALKQMLLYEDEKLFVLNKPAGLAVQGGSGIKRHIDGMLASYVQKNGEKPRLVHRLDRETSGVLVVARSRSAARSLAQAFRQREIKKRYWALVRGAPQKKEGKISNFLVKEPGPEGDRVRVCSKSVVGSEHAISYYRVLEQCSSILSWLEMEPYTGRTHQLRVHAAALLHPIIGDAKYFEEVENWHLPQGMQNKLHLHARSIELPHPSGGVLRIVAPLPPHMVQSFNLFGFVYDKEGKNERIL